ncbi:MAG: DNA alkylation repair protein [Chloroflexi bacterium]|nr:DNA alkylation repair protein [Chloroflexota bacterium]
MPNSQPDWLTTFTDAAERNDIAAAVAALDTRKTAHAGTANASDKRAAARQLVDFLGDQPAELFRWGTTLADQASPSARELASVVLVRSYSDRRDDVMSTLRRLAHDDNWEVREWAAGAAGQVFGEHFDRALPTLESWSADSSQHVRRAAAVATMGAAHGDRPERCEPLFALLEKLLPDDAEEVRRNLGPFAIGGAMLRHYPEQTIARARNWAKSEDEMVRWNTAMVFVAANAKDHIDDALDILSGLASDKRRLVWMAVSSALRNIAKRDPDRVVPILRTWLEDDRKLPAALALRHTTLAD